MPSHCTDDRLPSFRNCDHPMLLCTAASAYYFVTDQEIPNLLKSTYSVGGLKEHYIRALHYNTVIRDECFNCVMCMYLECIILPEDPFYSYYVYVARCVATLGPYKGKSVLKPA